MATCALVGAADFNAEAFSAMDAAGTFDTVIAVDAGYEHLCRIERACDLVLGDFDSLGYKPTGIRKVTYSPHKDKSDMELAIDYARRLRQSDLVVFGALGRRLDHTLANLQVFAQASERDMDVRMVGINEEVFFVTGPDMVEFDARPSGTISVFAMNDQVSGLFERGLEWELDDVELTARTSLGLSNEFKGEAVLIGVEEGTIIVICPL